MIVPLKTTRLVPRVPRSDSTEEHRLRTRVPGYRDIRVHHVPGTRVPGDRYAGTRVHVPAGTTARNSYQGLRQLCCRFSVAAPGTGVPGYEEFTRNSYLGATD
eukprot:1218815-Rhodomonas_salina.1